MTFRITPGLKHSLLVVLQSAGDWGRTVHISLARAFVLFFLLLHFVDDQTCDDMSCLVHEVNVTIFRVLYMNRVRVLNKKERL